MGTCCAAQEGAVVSPQSVGVVDVAKRQGKGADDRAKLWQGRGQAVAGERASCGKGARKRAGGRAFIEGDWIMGSG